MPNILKLILLGLPVIILMPVFMLSDFLYNVAPRILRWLSMRKIFLKLLRRIRLEMTYVLINMDVNEENFDSQPYLKKLYSVL